MKKERQRNRKTEEQKDRGTVRQRNRKTEEQKDRGTERQRNIIHTKFRVTFSNPTNKYHCVLSISIV